VNSPNVRSLFEPKDPHDIKPSEYSASLRIFSDTLSLPEITRLLGAPTEGYDIGEPVSGRRSKGPKRTQTAWLLRSSSEGSVPLEVHVEEVVSFVEKRSAVIDELRSECRMDIFCGVFRGDLEAPARLSLFVIALGCGFTLDPELTRRLAALRLSIGFDIY
jgi:hypothetical protein